ncbi:phosphoglycerate dehydrogenase-like enzyme [Catenuloplanes nepalensis]|uniref:Phosphoglycerate dehydrogenase-like enzyme n=1 Tax=Catenuloplanes nepalensis TaxID=587533 RepID=A0ABT9N1B6_9ACTN|nr:2-hydroxyacid dehydrogenase [Catenuloplanes nepalensis]MDP9797283.1 phosphoglycerate dehydrogenase-like enzyme [Catenuloplanes nepalensis]
MKIWIPHEHGAGLMGDLPSGTTVEVLPGADAPMPSAPDGVRFWVPPFLARDDVATLAARLPDLEVVQLLSAGAEVWTGQLPAHVTLCDARGVHDSSTAEWAMTAILSHVRGFPAFGRAQAAREWSYTPTDELAGKRVLIVGAGSIGTALAARLHPFEVTVTLVARRARPDEQVHAVDALPALLPHADIVVLILPLTDTTRGLADAAFLGAMPDGALLVNAARGAIVDTEALLTEVSSGRLSAALDVTDPEPLPADHPLWTLPNVLITPHVAGSVPGHHRRAYALAGTQLHRFATGIPLENVVTDGY